MYEQPDLRVEHLRSGVLLVRIDRPDQLNALTFNMFDQLVDVCDEVARDPDVRVMILTGTGRGFCAGLDLDAVAALLDMSPAQFLRGQEKWAAASVALHRLPKPVIAAVNGPAAGAGMSLALACDLRVVAHGARFNAAFIRVGLTGGDMGSSWLLPRIVGLGRANELLLTGRFVDADEAVRIGLANRAVPAGELLEAACELAEQICANSPFGVELTTQAVAANLGAATLELGVELENRNQALAAAGPQMREALAAFSRAPPGRLHTRRLIALRPLCPTKAAPEPTSATMCSGSYGIPAKSSSVSSVTPHLVPTSARLAGSREAGAG